MKEEKYIMCKSPVRRVNIIVFCGIIFTICFLNFAAVYGQPTGTIKSVQQYRVSVSTDADKQMIEIKKIAPDIVYDLRYASKKNFTEQRLYPIYNYSFVRLPVALALRKVADTLASHGLRLKIWDAYRPWHVTKKMWNLIGDERYVANPTKGSGHNRGLAVDVTLIDLKNNRELNMGTGFDNFSDSAHISFTGLPDSVLAARLLLKDVMEKNGFTVLETEWWHYNYPNNKNYEVLDLSFKQLRKNR